MCVRLFQLHSFEWISLSLYLCLFHFGRWDNFICHLLIDVLLMAINFIALNLIKWSDEGGMKPSFLGIVFIKMNRFVKWLFERQKCWCFNRVLLNMLMIVIDDFFCVQHKEFLELFDSLFLKRTKRSNEFILYADMKYFFYEMHTVNIWINICLGLDFFFFHYEMNRNCVNCCTRHNVTQQSVCLHFKYQKFHLIAFKCSVNFQAK